MEFRRQRYTWRIRGAEVPLGARTLLMGVLDLSVAGAGEKPDPDERLECAQRLAEAGADLIDVCVLPPTLGPRRIVADEELRAMVPTLRKLRAYLELPYSVCTYNSETAARAVELGAAVINDPSGLAMDPFLGKVVNQSDAGLVLGFAPGPPEEWAKGRSAIRPMEAVMAGLESAIARARRVGIERRRVVVDPGLGIAKRGGQNYEILEKLRDLSLLDQPIMVSPSKKPFLTDSIRAPERDFTIAAAAATAGPSLRSGRAPSRDPSRRSTARCRRRGMSPAHLGQAPRRSRSR
jgi:dihydropteroate synthase